MEPVEKEKAALISGIEEDARVEEEKIIKDAESQASEKRKYAEKKIESLLNDAQEKAREQADIIKKKILSSVELEAKRMSMRIQDSIVQDIMNRVEQKLGSMIDDPNYKPVLIDWITEAAIGLDAESAEVNASERERTMIDSELLSEAGRKVHERTGKQVTLTLSTAQPLKAQGVVVTAADGRTAFNNQVKTRMLRRQRDIRVKIYNALFSENRKE
ncbi:V-type ATP synthase subunit E [Planctomycetota bacterium]